MTALFHFLAFIASCPCLKLPCSCFIPQMYMHSDFLKSVAILLEPLYFCGEGLRCKSKIKSSRYATTVNNSRSNSHPHPRSIAIPSQIIHNGLPLPFAFQSRFLVPTTACSIRILSLDFAWTSTCLYREKRLLGCSRQTTREVVAYQQASLVCFNLILLVLGELCEVVFRRWSSRDDQKSFQSI